MRRTESAATLRMPEPSATTAAAWASPSAMPPRNAPNGRPKPPTIAAMKPLIANGVHWPPSQFEAGFVSTAHGEEDALARTERAAKAAFAAVAA